MAVRVVANAPSPQAVAIAPTARSVAALLAAIGVADEDMDGVVEVLSDEEQFPPESVPKSYLEIMQQVRRAHSIHLNAKRSIVVEAASAG